MVGDGGDVLPVKVAPSSFDRSGEGFSIALAPARIGVKDAVTIRSEELEFMEELLAILRVWPTMYFEYGWCLLSFGALRLAP